MTTSDSLLQWSSVVVSVIVIVAVFVFIFVVFFLLLLLPFLYLPSLLLLLRLYGFVVVVVAAEKMCGSKWRGRTSYFTASYFRASISTSLFVIVVVSHIGDAIK